MAVDFGRTKLLRFDDDELINKINIVHLLRRDCFVLAVPQWMVSNSKHNASNPIK